MFDIELWHPYNGVLLRRPPVVPPEADAVVNPGESISAAINSLGTGTRIYLAPGLHRATAISPKQGMTVFGAPGLSLVDGSTVKSAWTQSGSRWYATHTFLARDSTMRDGTYSVCETSAVTGTNLCWDRDQVWIDGERMTRMASLAAGDGASGHRFFTDRGAGRIYIWTDPSGHLIEIDSVPYFIQDSTVNDVTLQGLTFQRFASPLQRAGVSISGDGWEIDECSFIGNHASGLHATNVSDLWVHDSTFAINGQIGMTVGSTSSGTTPSGTVVERCEFTSNNMEDFYIGDWEAGGFKTTALSGGVVRDCTFYENRGLDLWVDFGGGWTFEDNVSTNAWGQAIRIEVAKNCIVRRNTIRGSGKNIGDHYRASHSNWSTVLDTCAISISECQYVEAYENDVDDSLNGIIVNIRGRQDTHHVFVHHNTVRMTGQPVPTGAAGTSTFGTMIAGGAVMASAPGAASTYFGVAENWTMPGGSGVQATERVQVRDNTYTVSGLTDTARFAWLNNAGSGTSYFTASVYAADKNPADATAISVAARPGFRVAHSGDDGTWGDVGTASYSSSTTSTVIGNFDVSTYGKQAWVRFFGVNIPQGATIDSAYLDILARGINGSIPALRITGDKQADSPRPTSRADVTGRPRTTASVPWTPESWSTAWLSSASLVPVIQEIVNQPTWVSGNAITLFLSPDPMPETFSGVQEYISFNGFDNSPGQAPGLVVSWH